MMKKLLLVFFLPVSLACGALPVAALNGILADIAQNIGGNRIEVLEVVQRGMDPHLYEPTPGDIKRISETRLVLASGLGLESYLDELQTSVGNTPHFFIAGDFIKPIYANEACQHGDKHQHIPGKVPDPHWWHSIENTEKVARKIQDALITLDPEGRTVYESNTRAFTKQLKTLARWARLQVASLPKERRILVTSHDALGYFARDYGFEVRSVQGVSTAAESSSQKLHALIHEIKSTGVKAIFAENIENPQVLMQITKESGAALGGTLYADNLGMREGDTYEKMMRLNIMRIVSALNAQ